MSEPDAMAVADELLSTLGAAVHSVEAETLALKQWDRAEVMACTIRREAFTAEAGEISARLKAALSRERSRSPALQGKLRQLQGLTAKLAAGDALNRELARRVLSFTKAYFNALVPKGQAYDRRGQTTSNAPPPSTISQRL